jgi:hypothetical protein
MSQIGNLSRRYLLKKLAIGASLFPLATARLGTGFAAVPALLSTEDSAAKALKYVEDASQAKEATPGNNCANCALYQGKDGSIQGPCQLFPGKQVKAAGWCSSWAPQM